MAEEVSAPFRVLPALVISLLCLWGISSGLLKHKDLSVFLHQPKLFGMMRVVTGVLFFVGMLLPLIHADREHEAWSTY